MIIISDPKKMAARLLGQVSMSRDPLDAARGKASDTLRTLADAMSEDVKSAKRLAAEQLLQALKGDDPAVLERAFQTMHNLCCADRDDDDGDDY